MSEKIIKTIEMTKEHYEICKEKSEKLDALLEANEIYDYMSTIEIYDIKYIVNEKLEYKAVRICTDTGGPGVYIDTWDEKVELYWSSHYAEYRLSYNVCKAIDEYWQEQYEMSRL